MQNRFSAVTARSNARANHAELFNNTAYISGPNPFEFIPLTGFQIVLQTVGFSAAILTETGQTRLIMNFNTIRISLDGDKKEGIQLRANACTVITF